VWPKAENQLIRPSSPCTDEHGQTIYANLDNAITLFRHEVRHRGTVIAFTGGANDGIVVSDTPDQILKSAKG
jgi:hypothetical protein